MIAGLALTWATSNGDTGEAVLERIRVAFERTGDELADFGSTIFPRLTPIFEAEMEKQFESEGSGQSGPWAQLSPAYEAWKSANYPGNPIGQLTGNMMAGLTQSSSPFATRQFGGDVFEFGTSGVPYADTFHLGTATQPSRAVFDFSPDFERDLAEAALGAARDVISNTGLDEFVDVEGGAGGGGGEVFVGSRGGLYRLGADGSKRYLR